MLLPHQVGAPEACPRRMDMGRGTGWLPALVCLEGLIPACSGFGCGACRSRGSMYLVEEITPWREGNLTLNTIINI